ncbi:MAG: ferrochelatase [Myxococcales bacterium]|nr:ferrochelatase [Myxococcales bacterium]
MSAPAMNETHPPLDEVEAKIQQRPRGPSTLDPSRSAASSLTAIVSTLADPPTSPYLAAAAAAVAEAQLESFPENLFWDFDFYLASIHRHALAAADYPSYLRNATDITVGLMRLYGQQSAIRFRYVHDFMYGFDWARWVRRDPEARSGVAPFGLDFLRQIESRGQGILTLIEAEDDWYPNLSEGASRNLFPFSREPEDERRLYRLLAERGCIPVQAWRLDAQPDASRDFDALREDAAESLGLSR